MSICTVCTHRTMEGRAKGGTEIGISTASSISKAYAEYMLNLRNSLTCVGVSLNQASRETATTGISFAYAKHRLNSPRLVHKIGVTPGTRQNIILERTKGISFAYAKNMLRLYLWPTTVSLIEVLWRVGFVTIYGEYMLSTGQNFNTYKCQCDGFEYGGGADSMY